MEGQISMHAHFRVTEGDLLLFLLFGGSQSPVEGSLELKEGQITFYSCLFKKLLSCLVFHRQTQLPGLVPPDCRSVLLCSQLLCAARLTRLAPGVSAHLSCLVKRHSF